VESADTVPLEVLFMVAPASFVAALVAVFYAARR
jgi:hypothetical protein